jgi:LysR family transcriptional regulator, cyn operon transcriptional activator
MELRHLRYFVRVAEAASVSKAALSVHISQPALSRQIRDLEAELGLRLFDRVGRRIQLTAAGRDLLEQSRAVLVQVDAIDKRARALIAGAVGSLRIGATPQTMQSLLAGFLASYRRSRPGVEISLAEAGGVRLHDLLLQGDLDLAVSGILAGTGFASRRLFPIRLLAVAAAGPRWKGRSTLEIVELAHERVLLLGRDFGTRQLFDAACRIAHLRPRCVLEGTEPHSLIALAEAGHGIAVVPSAVWPMSKMTRIMPILQDGKSLGTWSSVSWDARRSLPVYAVGFVEELDSYSRRNFPGKQFNDVAPPVPQPPDDQAISMSRRR